MPRAIEYVILAPMLLLQIFLFPPFANQMALYWAEASRQVTLQDAANYVGSSIQQLYLSLDQKEIGARTTTQALTLPPTIDSYIYTGEGSLGPSLIPDDPDNSARVLTLSFTLQGTRITATSTVTVGPNVMWDGGTLQSNSPNASLRVQKDSEGVLHFSFE